MCKKKFGLYILKLKITLFIISAIEAKIEYRSPSSYFTSLGPVQFHSIVALQLFL